MSTVGPQVGQYQ